MTADQLTTLLAGTDISKMIVGLKAKVVIDKPKTGQIGQTSAMEGYKKQFYVDGHDSLDKNKRPDRIVETDNGSRTEMTNQIGIGMQEVITERAVSFLFGSPVKIVCDPQNDNQKLVLKALNKILKDNKIDSFNAEVALEMFRSTEIAEVWFPITKAEDHNDYGFPTKFKLRSMKFSPWDGNELFPLFDETNDLIAFSRGYVVIEEGKEVNRFETYTATSHIVWKQDGANWVEVSKEANPIKKIPVVYGRQQAVEWNTVQNMIDRLEYLLSNYADTIDYHASPTIFVEGKIEGFSKKGESGKILEAQKGATAKYLSWEQAPDMVKLEIDTLIRFIFSISQTPDISFEAVKGLSEISGIALKMLFLDAHLKVKKKQRVFDAYLERRTNIIRAYIGMFKTDMVKDVKEIEIEAQIQPFMIDDLASMIETLMTANGNKPILSQETTVGMSGLADDAKAEYKKIKQETDAARAVDIFDPINNPVPSDN